MFAFTQPGENQVEPCPHRLRYQAIHKVFREPMFVVGKLEGIKFTNEHPPWALANLRSVFAYYAA